jgi:formate dehydrogenase alpha subunit
MTNSIDELENDADCIFLIGTNTWENHPVIAMKIKMNVMYRGAKLIVADPRRTEMADTASVYMQHKPGTDVALLNGIMHVIIKEGLADKDFIEKFTEGYELLAEVLEKYTPEYASEITGVPVKDIIKAARIYGKAEAGSFCYAMGITQHSTGTDNVKSVCNLSMLTGNIGRPGTGVNPLRGQNNVQGACDMGALPVVYTGYQKVVDPKVQAKFEEAWGVKLSGQAGLTVTKAINEAFEGNVKGLFVLGENPMMSDPNIYHVEDSLKNLDFLVVQDIFLTETAQLADVVLPAACFAEKEGTFTNTERRVQLVKKAVDPPGEAKPDWQVICELSKEMGYPMRYNSVNDIFKEITKLTPSYAGMTFKRLEGKGLSWPCPHEEHLGTKYLHKDGSFARGKGLFAAVDFKEPVENPDVEYPLILTTGRSLFHYHTGTMTRRSAAVEAHMPENWVEINPKLAEKYNVVDGEMVKLTTRRGSIDVKAKLTDMINESVVFTTFHFAESAANILTNEKALDPTAGIPEYKVCSVKLEKII